MRSGERRKMEINHKEHEIINRFDFEDDSYAIINPDNTVSVFDDEGRNYKIIGFESYERAKSFILFADFEKTGNSYLSTTGSKEKLEWVY